MKIITHNNSFVVVLFILHAVISANAIATLLTLARATTTAAGMPCKQPAGMWGDVNPNIFYVCDKVTNTSVQLHCPEGRGFFNGLGYYGCIPYEQWPACLHVDSDMHECYNEHLLQSWQSKNPNTFYICLAEGQEPLLINCEPGKGFVHAPVPEQNTAIMGCAKWEQWRSYMQCESYY